MALRRGPARQDRNATYICQAGAPGAVPIRRGPRTLPAWLPHGPCAAASGGARAVVFEAVHGTFRHGHVPQGLGHINARCHHVPTSPRTMPVSRCPPQWGDVRDFRGKDLRIPDTTPEHLAKALLRGGAEPRAKGKRGTEAASDHGGVSLHGRQTAPAPAAHRRQRTDSEPWSLLPRALVQCRVLDPVHWLSGARCPLQFRSAVFTERRLGVHAMT